MLYVEEIRTQSFKKCHATPRSIVKTNITQKERNNLCLHIFKTKFNGSWLFLCLFVNVETKAHISLIIHTKIPNFWKPFFFCLDRSFKISLCVCVCVYRKQSHNIYLILPARKFVNKTIATNNTKIFRKHRRRDHMFLAYFIHEEE